MTQESNETSHRFIFCHAFCNTSMILSLLGLLSQLLSLIVVWRVRAKARLFVYLTFYTTNNALVCIFLFLQLLHHVYLSDSYAMTEFIARFNLPFIVIGYQNTFFSIILVILDPLSNFNSKLEKLMKKHSPNWQCVLTCMLSFFPNLPVFLMFEAKQEQGDWFIAIKPFFQTQAGRSMVLLLMTVCDFLIIPVHIGLQIWSFICIKRHVRRKTSSLMSQRLHEQYQNTDLRTTIMFLYFAVLSIFEHLFRVLEALNLFELSSYSLHQQIEAFCLLLVVTMKSFSFFTSLIFNRTFRHEFFNMIGIL